MSRREKESKLEIAEERYGRIQDLAVTAAVVRECLSTDMTDAADVETYEAAITSAIDTRVTQIEPNAEYRQYVLDEVDEKLSQEGAVITSAQYAQAAKTLEQVAKISTDMQDLDLKPVYASISRKREDAATREKHAEVERLHREDKSLGRRLVAADALLTVGLVAMAGGLPPAGVEIYAAKQLPMYSSASGRSLIEGQLGSARDDLRFTPAGYRPVQVGSNTVIKFQPASLPNNDRAWNTVGTVQDEVRPGPSNITYPLATVERDLAYPVFRGRNFDDLFAVDRQVLGGVINEVDGLGQSTEAGKYKRDLTIGRAGLVAGVAGVAMEIFGGVKHRRARGRRKEVRRKLGIK